MKLYEHNKQQYLAIMSDKQAEKENVYKKYSIRSEHALYVTTYTNEYKSHLWIEGKLWEFTYESSRYSSDKLRLQMLKKNSSAAGDNKTTAAEIIVWYWNAKKEIVILLQKVYGDFSYLNENAPSPVDYKFNVVIRLLDKRNENDGKNSLLESYYGDFGKVGIDMVTFYICGTDEESAASFTVPKLNLMQASPVFHRMFTAPMTEKATGEVKIEDTTVEEFGDFLKAISPKQEYPNPSNVRALLKLADRYQCQFLRTRCENHLMNCIEISLVERIKYAKFYGLKDLKENLLMHFEGIGILELYQEAKPHRDVTCTRRLINWFEFCCKCNFINLT